MNGEQKLMIELCSRAIILHQGHLLAVRVVDIHDMYFLPGGHIEIGENPLDAIHRELEEELPGLRFLIGEPLGIVRQQFRDATGLHDVENYFYRANLVENIPLPKLPQLDAAFENHWLPLRDLSRIDLRPSEVIEIIRGLIAKEEK